MIYRPLMLQNSIKGQHALNPFLNRRRDIFKGTDSFFELAKFYGFDNSIQKGIHCRYIDVNILFIEKTEAWHCLWCTNRNQMYDEYNVTRAYQSNLVFKFNITRTIAFHTIERSRARISSYLKAAEMRIIPQGIRHSKFHIRRTYQNNPMTIWYHRVKSLSFGGGAQFRAL